MIDPLKLDLSFWGENYGGNDARMRFNNAVERMSQSRMVKQVEVDIEEICHADSGTVYAAVYHYTTGKSMSDMIIKKKNGGITFYRFSHRCHPFFINAYISSVYGYKKLSEFAIIKEIALHYNAECQRFFTGSHCLQVYSGGIELARAYEGATGLVPRESLYFVPYEKFDRDSIKNLYAVVLKMFVTNKGIDFTPYFSELLVEKILGKCLKRVKSSKEVSV